MTVGNLAALRQRHAVRLLAWSSVAQAGYLLVPLAAGGSDVDVGQMQAYALMYAVVNLGAFAVVVAAGVARGGDGDRRLHRPGTPLAAARDRRWSSRCCAWPDCRRASSGWSPRW